MIRVPFPVRVVSTCLVAPATAEVIVEYHDGDTELPPQILRLPLTGVPGNRLPLPGETQTLWLEIDETPGS